MSTDPAVTTGDPALLAAFDSDDVDEIQSYFSEAWGTMRIGGGAGERTRARVARRALNSEIFFDDADYSFAIEWSASPPGQLIISDIVAATIELDDAGRGYTFGPGDQFAVARPGVPYRGVAHSTRLRLTVIEPALLDRVVLAADGAAGDPVRLLDFRPVSAEAAQRLRQCTAFLRDTVLPVRDAPLIMSTAAQYLAASVLNAYPNTAVLEPTIEDRHDASPPTVRRAVAFIETHPDLDLSVADVARAAHVTPRALQLAFRRHLRTTPLRYLRRVRLDRAHADLLAADPAHDTVTAIAARWGWARPSRFAADYLAAYGRHPHQTLRS